MKSMQIVGMAGATIEVSVKKTEEEYATKHVVARLLTGTQLTDGLMIALTLKWQEMGADLPLSADMTAEIVAANHVPEACPEDAAGRN